MSKTFNIPPNAVRVWRGFRQPSLAQEEFFSRLGKTFIPSTVQMQIENGLDTYIPTIPCGLPNKPDTVPDETAILFWDSQDTYTAGFDTLAGRTYTLTHGGCYTPESGADFPTLYTGKIAINTCYYLIDKSADWMHGDVKHLVADANEKNLNLYTKIVNEIQVRGNIDGGVLCIGEKYIVYWQLNGQNDPGFEELSKLSDWKMERNPTDYQFPKGSALWDKWPGMEVVPGDSFNMQFIRQFELNQVQSQPVAPDSVHVWRGFKKGSYEKFSEFLGHVFLPSGTLLQPNAGLHAFLPSLPKNTSKPDIIPDQTALMFWTDQKTYADGFNKMAVRAYTNLHGDLYDTTKSKSGFPIYLGNTLDVDQPYYLIQQKADWMLGQVHHLLGQRNEEQTPVQFKDMVYKWAVKIRDTSIVGLEGVLLSADDNYVAIWMCWSKEATANDALEQLEKKMVTWLHQKAEDYNIPVGLWDDWVENGKPAGIPQTYPISLNIQLNRPRS